MKEVQMTLDDLTPAQRRIMEDFKGYENVMLPKSESQNSYWKLLDEPGRLGLLERVPKEGELKGFRLTDKGREILARS